MLESLADAGVVDPADAKALRDISELHVSSPDAIALWREISPKYGAYVVLRASTVLMESRNQRIKGSSETTRHAPANAG